MQRQSRRLRTRSRPTPVHGRGHGFTLVELLVVMAIIGVIITLILTAARAGIRRAEERATQALITKIESGLGNRVDALIAFQPDANDAHGYLSSAFTGTPYVFAPNPLVNVITSNQRAQVIARFDQMKAELPDVFVVQSDTHYPLNFGAAPFPVGAGSPFYAAVGNPYCQYMLPFGTGMWDDPTGAITGTASFGASSAVYAPPVTGMFGASFTAAGGIYKNLVAAAISHGATPPTPPNIGYDGVDNNGNGLIDDLGENGASVAGAVLTLLGNHTHKTARSEMLYALLVEGQGPLGSVFDRDDFSDSEVKDTDGDGLPEFVDAWGEPLQFYRWPVFYPTDSQQGARIFQQGPTMSPAIHYSFQPRQQNPLDTAQKLLDPIWWSGGGVAGFAANTYSPFAAVESPLSGGAFTFEALFTTITDPNTTAAVAASAPYDLWDRGSSWYARRAFYSRYLVLSGGPDKVPGVPVLDPAWWKAMLANYSSFTTSAATSITGASIPQVLFGPAPSGVGPIGIPTDVAPTAANIQYIQALRIEGQAAPATYYRTDWITYGFAPAGTAVAYDALTDPLSLALQDASSDDISNQNLQAPGGATQ